MDVWAIIGTAVAPFVPYIIFIGLGILVFALTKIKSFSFSKTEGVKIETKDEGKVVHQGQVYVLPELIEAKVDNFLEEAEDLSEEHYKSKLLSFENQMKFTEQSYNAIVYHILDCYLSMISNMPFDQADMKVKYLEMSLKTYWSTKLQNMFSSSFKNNGFHAFKTVTADGHIVDNESWTNFIDRTTLNFFHEFRHFLLGRYSFQPDMPVNDILNKIGFQVPIKSMSPNGIDPAITIYDVGKTAKEFIKSIYDNSWQCQEDERKVTLEFKKKIHEGVEALKSAIK